MKSYPTLRRWLSAALTIGVLVFFLAIFVKPLRSLPRGTGTAADEKAGSDRVWRLFGGSLQRNMVNTFDKNVPTEWSVEEGQEKNIKWVAQLGSRAYGGPVIAGGKIFVGTNNESPRNPQISLRRWRRRGGPRDRPRNRCRCSELKFARPDRAVRSNRQYPGRN